VLRDATPGPGKPTGLVDTLDRLAAAMAEDRARMVPQKAAEFLDMRYDEFRHIAPQLPRARVQAGLPENACGTATMPRS